MPYPTISNTSPVFYLHQLGQIELLRKLYKSIVVPKAVVDELEVGRQQGEDVPEIAKLDWVDVQEVRVPRLIGLVTDLGMGEAEVLALALDNPGSLCILDDSLARRIARLQKIKCTGTAGVLLAAKKMGYVSAVTPLLEQLVELGFWLRDETKVNILRLSGEI